MEIKFGIELELAYNINEIEWSIAGYHHDNTGDNFDLWSVTRDGSLNSDGAPFEAYLAELVSIPLHNKEEVMEALNELRDKYPNKEFKELFYINKSMGAHIHFSTWRQREDDMVFMGFYNKLRERVMQKVKDRHPRLYPLFKKQYYRNYAPKQGDLIIDKGLRGEISYTSGKGVEWRSFNLLGVETWDELFSMYEIALDTIEEILTEYQNNNYKEEVELAPTEDQIKAIEQEIVEALKAVYGDE